MTAPGEGVPRSSYDLPPGFELGVATSAYQIEGAWNADGKGPSIWDTFSQRPGNVLGDVPGDEGAGHYARIDEDLRSLERLGVASYRFSVAWSRVLPGGTGRPNPKGLAFYDRLIDSLLERGISPSLTLYHWDLPQALEDRGGWLSRDVRHWFGDYARLLFDRYGDRVDRWATLNEPIANWVGYGLGFFAPGGTDPRDGRTAMHHALLAHGQAVREFRDSRATGRVGIVVDVWKRSALSPSPETEARIRAEEADSHEFFLNPLFRGGYSDFQLRRWAEDGTLPEIREGDLALAAEPVDYFGLNVYNRVIVDGTPEEGEDAPDFLGGNYLDRGHYYDPSVATEVLKRLRDHYGVTVPIYVTENGTANCNEGLVDGRIDDHDRIRYVRDFLEAISRAAAEGVDVRGYSLWSLLDNYEWSAAYSDRYGIIHVDFDTFERTWKESAYWYQRVNAEHSLRVEPRGAEDLAAEGRDVDAGER